MSSPKIRVIGNACITRYNNGEGTIWDIINSYTALTDDEKQEVYNYIISIRPDIAEGV